MLDEETKKILRRQHYKLVGENAAVKLCLWAKRALKGEGFCYKQQFYGIPSHRCVQMTPCVSTCTQNCLFCWRASDFTSKLEKEDEPEKIFQGMLDAQRSLLSGFGGIKEQPAPGLLEEARKPSQVAISLSGEPTLYSQLPEFIELIRKNNMTSFLVSNGANPEMLARVKPTQLYVSLCAPDEETHKKLCAPSIPNAWGKLNDSLELMRGMEKQRTTLRMTLVKGENLHSPEKYAKLIAKANPMFVELKSYMCVGFSTKRFDHSNMPRYEEIMEFAGKVAEENGYIPVDSNNVSRVALLARDEKTAGKRMISKLV
ncbi:4-demethylwyosine synthase TYW1 [Candidatus Micrarchaeota archaeon]|nr:4-demethylwyosine synthase TYW1 [Candidatus Micrarchaeota archaeon]